MSRPDDTPLSVTADVLKAVSQHALSDPSIEACGYIFGRGGVGSHVIGMPNVAEQPERAFDFGHGDILAAFREADAAGLDLIAVYHSHPTSEAIPSPKDKSVPDLQPAQLIISLRDGAPRCRAWRIDVPFMGERRATEVMLHVSEDGQPFVMKPPMLPWALTPGNQVTIEYTRTGSAAPRAISVKITGILGGTDPAASLAVRFESTRKTDPKVMDLSRIRAVTVTQESPAAQRLRGKMTMLSRRVAALIHEGRFEDVPPIVEILNAAFPPGMAHHTPGGQS